MKKKYFIIPLLLVGCTFRGCPDHPRKQPHNHKVTTVNAEFPTSYYIVGELEWVNDGCLRFKHIDNNDFEGYRTTTVCGNFRIDY